MAHRKARRRSGFAACALSGLQALRGAEEDALEQAKQRIMAEAQAKIAAAETRIMSAKRVQERRERVAKFIQRCAERQVSVMPDESAVCFKFSGGKVTTYSPSTGRAAAAGVPHVGPWPITRPESLKPGTRKHEYSVCYWANIQAGMNQGQAIKACSVRFNVEQGTIWASLTRGRGSARPKGAAA